MPTTPKRKRPVAERKQPIPVSGKRPARAEILKGIGWKALPAGLLPENVHKAEDRRMQNEIVAWTLGLWNHVNGLKTATKWRKPAARRKV